MYECNRVTCKLCEINSMHSGCCHRTGFVKKESVSNVAVNNVSSVMGPSANLALTSNQIKIINATPSTGTDYQTNAESMNSCLNYVGETDPTHFYYPKICARHRVPSVKLFFSKNFFQIVETLISNRHIFLA